MDKTGRDAEDVALPQDVEDVRGLLVWLRGRGDAWQQAFADNAVRVTVNKQFANLGTKVNNAAEIAFIPMRF